MVESCIKGIRLCGLAAAVSNKWTPVTDLIFEGEEPSIRKFMKNTGVTGRYDAGRYQTAADFCTVAARELIDKKKIDKNEIGLLIFVTQTADYNAPATACVIQHRLGLSVDCMAFDLNMGCSGFIYGLQTALSIMNSSNIRKGLLLCGDTFAKERTIKHSEKLDHSYRWLFGDAGSALLLERCDEDESTIRTMVKTDGSGFEVIIEPYGEYRNPDAPSEKEYGYRMKEMDVFSFAINEVPALLRHMMQYSQKTEEDYDVLALHQSNFMILKQIAKIMKFPMDKVPVSLEKYGNTSSASIPISMVNSYGQMISEDKDLSILACGYGIGMSWGAADFTINSANILPIIHTDEYFKDSYYLEQR